MNVCKKMNSKLFVPAYRVTFGLDIHYIRYVEEGTVPFLQLVHQGKFITYKYTIKWYGHFMSKPKAEITLTYRNYYIYLQCLFNCLNLSGYLSIIACKLW